MSTAARAPRIATSLCPNQPSNSCAATGSPTAIPVLSSLPSAEAARGQRKLKLPWPKAVSKVPSVAPSLMPVSLKRELPYTRCAIPTLPTSSKPASTCASSNATWAMPNSKPRCSISTSPKRARKTPASCLITGWRDSTMTSINEIFRTFGPEYLQRYANSMPKTHLKVIDAMIACRTEACGLALYQCASCARSHELYRSCGNRHCPTCQHHKTQQWLEKQINRQLPTHHFLFTF